MIQIIEQSHEEKVEMYMKCTKKELTEMLIESNRQLDAAIKNWNIPVVTTSYLYLVNYKWSGGSGVYRHENKILQFEDIDDITIENIKERVSGQKYSEYIIENITPL